MLISQSLYLNNYVREYLDDSDEPRIINILNQTKIDIKRRKDLNLNLFEPFIDSKIVYAPCLEEALSQIKEKATGLTKKEKEEQIREESKKILSRFEELLTKEDPDRLALLDIFIRFHWLMPIYSLQELAYLTKKFITHLEKNKKSLIKRGLPHGYFVLCPFLDIHATNLYWTKMPNYIQIDRNNSNEIFSLRYSWELHSCTNISKHKSYPKFEYITELSQDEIELIENNREKLLEFKIKIFNSLLQAVQARIRNEKFDLLGECLELFTDAFGYEGGYEDFKSYCEMDKRLSFRVAKLRNKSLVGLIPKNLIMNPEIHNDTILVINPSANVNNTYYLPLGGISDLIEVIRQYDQWLITEEMVTIRKILEKTEEIIKTDDWLGLPHLTAFTYNDAYFQIMESQTKKNILDEAINKYLSLLQAQKSKATKEDYINHVYDALIKKESEIETKVVPRSIEKQIIEGLTQEQIEDYEKYNYKCYDRVKITNKTEKARHIIELNSNSIELENRLFKLFLRLAQKLKEDKNGWESFDQDNEETNANIYQDICDLRKALKMQLIQRDSNKFVACKNKTRGSKHAVSSPTKYRINTHPDFITISEDIIKES